MDGLTRRLWTVAQRSPCRYKVAAAAISFTNEVIAVVTNQRRFMHTGGGIHAEINLLRKCKVEGVKKVVLMRVGASGSLRPIAPCKDCKKLLSKLGIKWEAVQ